MSTRIVAIDGHGGAGKSTLAEELAEELGGARIVRTDDFASWDVPLNWWPRLLEEVLEPLSRGQAARYQRSSWKAKEDAGLEEIAPAPFVVLEGVSASRDAFRPFLTFSIWVETPRELCLQRGLERDGEQARVQWEEWMAEEDEYFEREQPRARADLVLRGDLDR